MLNPCHPAGFNNVFLFKRRPPGCQGVCGTSNLEPHCLQHTRHHVRHQELGQQGSGVVARPKLFHTRDRQGRWSILFGTVKPFSLLMRHSTFWNVFLCSSDSGNCIMMEGSTAPASQGAEWAVVGSSSADGEESEEEEELSLEWLWWVVWDRSSEPLLLEMPLSFVPGDQRVSFPCQVHKCWGSMALGTHGPLPKAAMLLAAVSPSW